ncbi:MAG: hypothetical protein PHU61_01000 [Candidatus Absconditabacteria bacterium]|nr:hypothetical protein [Candidatus Absconditabacteria bacterium]MDD3868742.1 hypothetical protein [Candidatus Absconditabacteria bacterium]MDD4714371.1 hypothetical protein [Candidatus Absconditabacteria bacterium]
MDENVCVIAVLTPKGKKRVFSFFRVDQILYLKEEIKNVVQFRRMINKKALRESEFQELSPELARLQIIALLLSAGMARKGDLDPLDYYKDLMDLWNNGKDTSFVRRDYKKIPLPFPKNLYFFLRDAIERDFNIQLVEKL